MSSNSAAAARLGAYLDGAGSSSGHAVAGRLPARVVQALSSPVGGSGMLAELQSWVDMPTCHIDDTEAEKGQTSLILAARAGRTEAVQLLLAAGAAVNATTGAGGTAAFVAAQEGHYGALRLLISAGANVNAPTHMGATAIFVAARNGHAECVRELIDAAANINATVRDGACALLVAVQRVLLEKDDVRAHVEDVR